MKQILLFCAAIAASSTAAWAEIEIGIRAGVPLTDAFDATQSAVRGFENVPKRYTVGPTLQVNLPFSLALTIDVLYKRLAYEQTEAGGATTTQTANMFELPVMLRYKFGEGNLKPFISGGPTFNKITAGAVRNPVQFVKSNTAGVVLGTGVEVGALVFKLTPELRYTRRGAESFRDAVGGLLKSNKDQIEFLVGFTF
jgi:hypothetical protein